MTNFFRFLRTVFEILTREKTRKAFCQYPIFLLLNDFLLFFKQRGHFCLWSLEVAGEDLSVRQLPHLEGAVCAAGVEQRPGQAHLGHSLAHVLEQTVPAHSTPHNSGQIGQNIRSKKSVQIFVTF